MNNLKKQNYWETYIKEEKHRKVILLERKNYQKKEYEAKK
jgi:hypothetical protein